MDCGRRRRRCDRRSAGLTVRGTWGDRRWEHGSQVAVTFRPSDRLSV
jgi:hypothetical protein